MARCETIFGNKIPEKTLKKAEKSRDNYIKKFGDDSSKPYRYALEPVPALSFMHCQKLVLSDKPAPLPENPLVVGNIRMGFGHYRISMAMASCAAAMGYTPLWLDLAGFDATGSKMIRQQNDMYSLASRISQRSHLFNHFVWEPMNRDGFRKLSYNAVDQCNSELLAPLLKPLPRDIPYIATHVWPAQGAVHAGMTHVVNAIPDNWPMALHLAEGSVHAVQTSFAYNGYKMLEGFDRQPLHGMGDGEIAMVGHYIDHELVSNLDTDNARRLARLEQGAPLRILLTVGGAGAGLKQFEGMLRHLMPYVKAKKAALFINFGDHRNVYDQIEKDIPGFGSVNYFNAYEELVKAVAHWEEGPAEGITCVCNDDIFQAVYATNLLMRVSDLLITKPSELAFYPIPKLFMRHIGGHEVYGGIHAQEIGDAIWECPTEKSMNTMLDRLLSDKALLRQMIARIDTLHRAGTYNGAYRCVELAAKK